MADFSNTNIQPLPNAVSPPRPVQDVSSIVATEAITQGLGNAFDILGGTLKASRNKSAEEAKGNVLTGFTNELGKIDNALQQGAITTQEASARKRAALVTYSANNPSLSTDLRTTYTSLEGKAGFGQATPEQRARDDAIENAQKFGFIRDGMSEVEMSRGLQNYNTIQKEQFELKQAQERLAYAKSELELDSSQRKAEEFRYNQKLRSSLPQLGNAFFDQTNISVNKVLENLERNGSSTEARQMAVRELQQMKANYNNQIAQFSIGADETTRASIKSLGSPIEQMINDAIEVANGNMTRDLFKNTISSNSNRSLMMMGERDPRVWGVIAVSEIAPKVAEAAGTAMGASLIDMIVNPSSVAVTAPGASKEYFESMGQLSSDIQSGTLPQNRQQVAQNEFNERNNGVLKSINHNSSVYEKGTDLKGTVEYLSGDAFRQFVKGGGMDPSAAGKALEVVQRVYQQDLLPKIEKVLSSNPEDYLGKVLSGAAAAEAMRATGASPSDIAGSVGSVSDMVDISWNGTTVLFVAKDGRQISSVAASKLNKEVAPLLSQTTRALAHLQGNDNYQQVFNEQVGPNVGLMPAQESAGAKGDRLSSPSQQTPTSRIDNAFSAAQESATTLNQTETAPTEPLQVTSTQPTSDGQKAITEAITSPSSTATSDNDLIKQARQSLEAKGIDTNSARGFTLLNAEYMKLKRSQGSAVSKAAQQHAKAGGESASAKVPKSEVVNYISEGLQDRGLPPHVAEGFLLNFQDESGFNPGINERNPTVPGSRGGFGLYQLTGPRRKQYEAYAAAVGKPVDDIDTQLDFLMLELQGSESPAAKKILNTKNTQDAAVAILDYFLRPAKAHRDERAKRYSGK